MAEREVMYESVQMDDAEIAVVPRDRARTQKGAIAIARAEGIRPASSGPSPCPVPGAVIRSGGAGRRVLVVE